MTAPAFIRTERLELRPLSLEEASSDYLTWLNDSEVLRYRAPKAFPTTMTELRNYIDSVSSRGDLVLGIFLSENGRHIGNIALNSILWVHGSAELSMMIGAKDTWGKGLAKEAIAAICRHAFSNMRLVRVWAESPNPAFNAAVRALGWQHEGTKRKAFLVDGEFVDIECFALLRDSPEPSHA